jgi:hypothetical protein
MGVKKALRSRPSTFSLLVQTGRGAFHVMKERAYEKKR